VEKKKEYIIPLQKKINWRTPAHQRDVNETKASEKSEEELALDREAAAAIVKGL